jgi:exonuclease III
VNIVSWNYRGISSWFKEEALRDLIQTEKPTFLLVQETKVEDFESLKSCKLQWNKCDSTLSSSREALGGLCTLWNNLFLTLDFTFQTQHWILISFTHQQTSKRFNIFNVYMSVTYKEKESCWNTLLDSKDTEHSHNNIIVGYFNVILNNEEKRGGSIIRDPFRENLEDLLVE